eukprot:TRINITY_DN306_c1_g1_i2.p1 TRINITY_DN306_c1_g1~~TRINITY_DN306_c1_g1_i2.p1  ORF type:complete len:127 (-),score=1.45 TRINITY_DN306_c1_g1_i2:106-486(-)
MGLLPVNNGPDQGKLRILHFHILMLIIFFLYFLFIGGFLTVIMAILTIIPQIGLINPFEKDENSAVKILAIINCIIYAIIAVIIAFFTIFWIVTIIFWIFPLILCLSAVWISYNSYLSFSTNSKPQ